MCIYAYIHTYKLTHTCMCTHTYIYTQTHTHINGYISIKAVMSSVGLCSEFMTSLPSTEIRVWSSHGGMFYCQSKFNVDNPEIYTKNCFKKHYWCLNDTGIYNSLSWHSIGEFNN